MILRREIGYLWLILILIGLSFSIQNFDWLHFKLSSCSYYFFNPACTTKAIFFVNKLIRFLINILTLWLINHVYHLGSLRSLLYLLAGLVVLAGMDMLTINFTGFLMGRIHMVLHPIAFSPLISIGLLALVFFNLNRSSNQG